MTTPSLGQSLGLQTENLQSLTQGLLEGTQTFQSLVQDRLDDCAETPADILSAAVELVHAAQTLLSWLNRYLVLLPGLWGTFSSLAFSRSWERK